MSFLLSTLEVPRYGYQNNGALYVPTQTELWKEFFFRLNIFRNRKNWIQLLCWTASLSFALPMGIFLTHYFTWPLFFAGFFYSMVFLGTHGTIYYHRYGTHRAFQFSHPIWRFITKNLAIKIIPEEIYIVSHHVHHAVSEKPGDPYNVHAGWLYCFLADANHQPISKTLDSAGYLRLTKMLEHTGIRMNSYEEYMKWGSIANPYSTLLHFILNWLFWYGAFYLVGGHGLATALFGSAGVWAIGIRTFNYDGHGGGKDKRKPGVDFNRDDLSINQLWPGLITGEWHNNHHLYPNGARAGFLPYQLDYAWWYIYALYKLGAISSFRDYKEDFLTKHYLPYLRTLKTATQP